ncbi:hypothetical protein [Halobacillus sp. Nhm2S1]|uniref:hypothetical protein n=1 Tax=Halobacillus sp. Nhm2S1 TaxID=2866716 RepID=UPI001C732158|nr:hypothetical protein [Halobacillus sp. Nhm2S1]MBX0358445.1 hypothetical protein [Halobacillus sp. Nhm2S1]
MKKAIIGFLVLGIIVSSIYLFVPEKNNFQDQNSISDSDIEKFIDERGIEPLAIEKRNGLVYILEEGSKYTLYKSKEELSSAYTGWSNSTPQALSIGMSGGDNAHVYIIINDKKLINQGDSIEVTFSDESKVTKDVNGETGFIFFHESNEAPRLTGQWSVKIFDKGGEVIYQRELS